MGRCRMRGRVAGGATMNHRFLENVMRKEESGGRGDCLEVVQPRREGRKPAGGSLPRPRDARLHHSQPSSEDPETPAAVGPSAAVLDSG